MAAAPTLRSEMEAGKLMDSRTVSFLDGEVGRTGWEAVTVDLSKWDKEASAGVQNRSGHDEAAMAAARILYHQMSDEGGTRPPIIVKLQKDGTWFHLDGYQRTLVALERDEESLVAYAVKTDDPEILFYIAAKANDSINGFRNSPEDKRSQVEIALARFKRSNKDIARRLGVSESLVSDVKMTGETRERLNQLGVKHDELEDSVVKNLGGLTDDTVLEKAAEVAVDGKLPVQLVKDMVVDIKQGRSEQDRIERVVAFRDLPHIAGAISRASNGATTVVRRATRTFNERLLEAAAKLNKMLAGAQPDPDLEAELTPILNSIVTNGKRWAPDLTI